MILIIRVVGRRAFGTRSGGENPAPGLRTVVVAARALKSDRLAVLSFIINTLVSIDDYWSLSPRRGDCPEGERLTIINIILYIFTLSLLSDRSVIKSYINSYYRPSNIKSEESFLYSLYRYTLTY
jgi:hypothetical protein